MTKQGQASLEYLMVYGFAIMILVATISSIYVNQPDITPPEQCQTGNDFRCVEAVKQESQFLILLRPTLRGQINITEVNLTFRDEDHFDCDKRLQGDTETVSNLIVEPTQQFEISCNIFGDGDGQVPYVSERERAELEFIYEVEEFTFPRRERIDLIQ